ncbi:hypothetical protein [Terriglobus sp. TAA 43]|uniref:hypothetical protein n=1 Tax=Terriglobus sp. TAA 43 TaxID=278961 RepID=UPI00068B7552|nr:hypothetical protein [Terriglobus sp. TAA 43]
MSNGDNEARVRVIAEHRTRLALTLAVIAVVLLPIVIQGEMPSGTSGPASAPDVQSADKSPTGVEVLSDTRGVSFSPYLKTILSAIRTNWLELLPLEAHPPTSIKGETDIRFTILPDGTLGPNSMHVDGSTHVSALDVPAWAAIVKTKFPPLPKKFDGPGLELRIKFRVNLQDNEGLSHTSPQLSTPDARPAPAH